MPLMEEQMDELPPLDRFEEVHGWFGLSYASYFTIPRAVLQAMPAEWQARWVDLMREVDEVFDWMPDDCIYQVQMRYEPTGRFIHDALRNYRYPPEIKRR